MAKTGKWETYSGVVVSPEKLDEAIMDILESYGDVVYRATEEGLDAAEKILINNLRVASPKKSGNFAKGWKSKGKKYKLVRYVGNTTTVEGRSGKIALANIFEYSTTRGNPFIKQTYENSIDEMAQAVVNEIKKEV
jgi:hypothetical protein